MQRQASAAVEFQVTQVNLVNQSTPRSSKPITTLFLLSAFHFKVHVNFNEILRGLKKGKKKENDFWNNCWCPYINFYLQILILKLH